MAKCGKNFKPEENRGPGAWLSFYLKQMDMIHKRKKKKKRKKSPPGFDTNKISTMAGHWLCAILSWANLSSR